MKSFSTFRLAQASTAYSLVSFRRVALGLVASLGIAAGRPAQAQTPAQAQEQQSQPVRTKQADAESLWMTIENPTLQRVQVQVIQLSSNSCLSNEINHQASYGCKLNFGKLPAGEYAVLLRVGRERYRYAVKVQNQQQRSTISVHETSPATEKTVASASL